MTKPPYCDRLPFAVVESEANDVLHARFADKESATNFKGAFSHLEVIDTTPESPDAERFARDLLAEWDTAIRYGAGDRFFSWYWLQIHDSLQALLDQFSAVRWRAEEEA